MSLRDVKDVVSRTQEYYDGPADELYRMIWGDNVHMGIPCREDCPHPEAMEHTNEIMAKEVQLGPDTTVLDLGCGYGSTARYLAANYGCHITGTNISEKELALARERCEEAGLSHLLSFEYGDFHDLKYADNSFDVVWSQESFLHGVDKARILTECFRVLKPGGTLIFTDILVRHDTPEADRVKIYDRVKSPDIWDVDDYLNALRELGFDITRTSHWPQHVARSYGWVRDQMRAHREALSARVEPEVIDSTIEALSFWVDSANAGKIGWSLFVSDKPA